MQDQNPQQSYQQPSTSYPQNQPVAAANVQNQQQAPAPLPPAPPKKGKPFAKIIIAIVAIFIVLILVVVGVRAITNRAGRAIDDNKPVELTWWGLWENASIIEPIIARYQEENPNVTINYERQAPDGYRERLSNSLARGNGPDIFRIHNTWVPMFNAELAVLPDEIMSQQEYEETFYRVALESALTAEGIKAIPLEFDGLGLFINEELFNNFALTTPESWQDVRRAAETISISDFQSETLAQAGMAMGLTSNISNWEEIIGLLLVQNRANKIEPSDDKSSEAFRFFRRFESEFGVWDSAQPESITAFQTGRVGMILADYTAAQFIRQENPGLKFRVVPVPQLPKFNPDDPDITYASFWMEGVSVRSETQLHAWRFLEYLTQAENLELLYQNAQSARDVYPELYPRQDMRSKLTADRYAGGIIKAAPDARFWYLASNTNDGETGLNTQLANLFETRLTARDRQIIDVSIEIRKLLAQYGLATPPPPVE